MQTELIIVSEYCHKCHIEPSFIEMLEEGGLINVHTEGGEHYLLLSELPNVERYSRMYYDLSINMEGIDAIHHLLERMEDMRQYNIRANLFQIACVDSVEAIQCITVDIQHPDNFPLLEDWYYYFRFRVRTTGYVSGKLLYIRNNQCTGFFPSGSANSSAKADASAGNGALKRTQYEFFLFHKVKAYPEETESLL